MSTPDFVGVLTFSVKHHVMEYHAISVDADGKFLTLNFGNFPNEFHTYLPNYNFYTEHKTLDRKYRTFEEWFTIYKEYNRGVEYSGERPHPPVIHKVDVI